MVNNVQIPFIREGALRNMAVHMTVDDDNWPLDALDYLEHGLKFSSIVTGGDYDH